MPSESPRTSWRGQHVGSFPVMAERSLRGTNLSALSMETDTNVVLSERQIVRYVCPEKHISELPFSVEADVPSVWECRCGVEARLVDGPEPEYRNVKAVRTHWDMLLERRSIPELEELLKERLALLRTMPDLRTRRRSTTRCNHRRVIGLVNGRMKKNPTMSVRNPGVSNSVPPIKTSVASASSRPGIWPVFKAVRKACQERRPSCLTR